MEVFNVIELLFLFVALVFLGGIFLTAWDMMFSVDISDNLKLDSSILTTFEYALNLFFSWFGVLIAVAVILVILYAVVKIF